MDGVAQRHRPAKVPRDLAHVAVLRDGGHFEHGRNLELGGAVFGVLFQQFAQDHLAHAGGAQVEPLVGKVVEQVAQALVALPGAAQRRLGVKVNVAKDALQFLLVRLLNLFQGDIDNLAQVIGVALLVERLKVTACGQFELFVAQRPPDALLVAAVALQQLFVAVAPDIGDVLDEEHDEDIVLVFGRVNGAAKGVAGPPEDVVDFGLVDGVHWVTSLVVVSASEAKYSCSSRWIKM